MTLGIEMQGVNGTLTSIVTMLSLAELGIGTAIICNLYKPLEEGNRPKIIALMQFYGKAYRFIAIAVFILGLCVAPFLGNLIEEDISNLYLTQVFLLFLADVVISYLFAYKRSIITADQKNYLITIAHLVAVVLMNVFQIAILILTQNFILYLLFKIAFRLLENLWITWIANHRYPYILTKEKIKIDQETKENIIGNTKALGLHYIGNYLINGTDMLIITKFLGLAVSGIYSNYLIITTVLRELLGQFSIGITAGFGNLLACGEKDGLYRVFNHAFFVAFVMANFTAISLFCLFNPFIILWLGPDMLLNWYVVLIIVANYYIVVLSEPIGALRASAGLFRPDRYLHLFLAALNIVVSVGLVQVIGIFGVFLGTLLCLIIKEVSVLPYIVYSQIFKKKTWQYQKKLCFYGIITFILGACTYFLCGFVSLSGPYMNFIVRAFICLIVPNGIVALLFCRTAEFKYFLSIVINIKAYLQKSSGD